MSFIRHGFATGLKLLILSVVAGAGLLSIIATGGGGSTDIAGENGTGTLSIGLTDASTNGFLAVYITIKEVQVHHADGDWETVGYPGGNDGTGKTYNLLELVNGVVEQLVLTEMEPGNYTQMRLILGDQHDGGTNILGNEHPSANYIIDKEGPAKIGRMTVPSGMQSGIKLTHPFTISEGGITELFLDFIVPKSIVKTGSGKYILKPTIKVIDTIVTSATLSGTVTEKTGDGESVSLDGVTVSAQYYDGGEPVIQSSTFTDENGKYKMILPEGIPYSIVAYLDGYAPSCIAGVVLETGENLTDQNFILAKTDTGTVSGVIDIVEGSEDDSALLSFRQDCSGSVIEVKAVPVGYNAATDDWPYSGVTLPAGTYTGIASTETANTDLDERENQQITFEESPDFYVTANANTELDPIEFPALPDPPVNQ